MFQISVVNGSRTLSDRDMLRAIRAINRQIAEDFEPFWAFGGRLRLDGSGPEIKDPRQLAQLRGDAILYVLDSAQGAGFLGYHDHNAAGVPFGYIFLDLCRQLGDEWTTTLSHEAMELIGDAQCNLLVQGPHPANPQNTVYHYFEMCDAVQTVTYMIDGVTVSDFVLPAYFASSNEQGARTSFCSAPLTPFGVTPGGYIGFFDPALNAPDTFFANNAVAAQRLALKTGHGSGRVARRGALTAQPGAGAAPADPIRHVVVLMLENRSFDHMLGALAASVPGLAGVQASDPRSNTDSQSGKVFTQSPAAVPWVDQHFAPAHEYTDVQTQLADQMGHFVDSYRTALGSKLDEATLARHQQEIMNYFKEGDLPVLHTLARHFMVCDHWFSSLPGPTWPNRFFVHSATCKGQVVMPSGSSPATWSSLLTDYDQDTIYDRLNAAQPPRKWKIFHDGFPQTALLSHVREQILSAPYSSMGDFVSACAGPESAFPDYAFIEPRYFDNTNGKENDQHPPASAADGEVLIAQVYNAIRQNQSLWNSTLLIITWDEHGGFYDHVPPPATVAPDSFMDTTHGFDFSRLGVRVPTVLVSPWIPAGVDHTVYDHSSILRYLCDKWRLPYLGNRMNPAVADSKVCGNFAGLISLTTPRTDNITVSATPPATQPAPTPWDDAREALLKAAEAIMHPGPVLGAAVVAPVLPPQSVDERIRAVDAWLASKAPQTPAPPPARARRSKAKA